eukprot:6213414-Pleurochrysis_carterae.AAC.9
MAGNSVHPANMLVTYYSFHRWEEWRRDGPTYTSLSVRILIFKLADTINTYMACYTSCGDCFSPGLRHGRYQSKV